MESLSNSFTGNHLLKDLEFGEQQFSNDSKNSLENLFSLESFETENSVEKGIFENSFNHLLSGPLQKSLSFEKFESLKLDVLTESVVFSSGTNVSEEILNIEKLSPSHLF
ncbi:MAG: hypothetical protein ABEI74_01405 [Candidatus Pacearchaeota archaeon]